MITTRNIIVMLTVLLSATSITQARYLHHAHGRFIQRDPLKYVDGMNTYLYVGNNPLNRNDLFGMSASAPMPEFLNKCHDCWQTCLLNQELLGIGGGSVICREY